MSDIKKKILVINTVPIGYDGITMVIVNYLSNMDKTELHIDFIGTLANPKDEIIRKRISTAGVNFIDLPPRKYKQRSYFHAFYNLIKDKHYDVMHIHCNSCTVSIDLLIAKLVGIKKIVTHSHNTTTEHSFIHLLLRPFFNILYTEGFACGQAAGEWLYGKNRKFKIFNNAIDLDRFRFSQTKRDTIREKYNIQNKIVLGHVGAFNYQKNHDFLIDVFESIVQNHNDYVLMLVGSGNKMDSIIEKVNSMGIADKVIFIGKSDDIPSMLDAMDLMLLPSHYEGLPNVIIESQSSGLPAIVSSNVSKLCNITNTISFIDLVADRWVEDIINFKILIDRNAQSKKNAQILSQNGYNIRVETQKLRDYYIK